MNPNLSPMLCGTVDVVPDDPAWAIEGKIDGWRTIAHVQTDVTIYGGRNGKTYSGQVPYIEAALLDVAPTDLGATVLDGELVSATGWNGVQSIMTSGRPHKPSKAIPALTFVIFDVLYMNGLDFRGEPWTVRREYLEQQFAFVDPLRLSPVADAHPDVHERFLKLGLEGSVLKRKDSRYVNGRTNLWAKCKPQSTEEGTIIGFKPGTVGSTFDGLVGAIEFELPNGQKSRCSGFDMKLREAMTANPDAYVGRTIEIKHHGETAEGKLRHPQFLRFRDDRDGFDERERQMLEMLGEAPQQTDMRRRQVAALTRKSSGRRMRNYKAMNDQKLKRVIHELERGEGHDAYDRCVMQGSGQPDADLAAARGLAQERGLDV